MELNYLNTLYGNDVFISHITLHFLLQNTILKTLHNIKLRNWDSCKSSSLWPKRLLSSKEEPIWHYLTIVFGNELRVAFGTSYYRFYYIWPLVQS